jgi:ornithine cyclodeaminase/alanine dehydrogenase-like protein (mu-crystallin family)
MVVKCLPNPAEQVKYVRDAFVALASSVASSPPKVGLKVPGDDTLEAMPAISHAHGVASLKWVAAFPQNRQAGLPQVHALLVLTDATTGVPLCIMDARPLTAARTAAVSAVAILALLGAQPTRVAIAGAGVQGNAHAQLLVAIGLIEELTVYDRHPERATALATEISRTSDTNVTVADSLRTAIAKSEVFVSCVSLGPIRQSVPSAWFRGLRSIVCIDDDMLISPSVVDDRFFVVDDRAQFVAFQRAGQFQGFLDPDAELTDILTAGSPTTDASSVFVALGSAISDLAIAEPVYENARSRSLGISLPG